MTCAAEPEGGPGAEPSFLLAAGDTVLLATGARRCWDSSTRAAAWLLHARTHAPGGPRVVLGEVAAHPHVPARLFQPEDIHREPYATGLKPCRLSREAGTTADLREVTEDPLPQALAAAARTWKKTGAELGVAYHSARVRYGHEVPPLAVWQALRSPTGAYASHLVNAGTTAPTVGISPLPLLRRHGRTLELYLPVAVTAAPGDGAPLPAANRKELSHQAHAGWLRHTVSQARRILDPYAQRLWVADAPEIHQDAASAQLVVPVTAELRQPALDALTLARALLSLPILAGRAPRDLICLPHPASSTRDATVPAVMGWCTAAGDGEWYARLCGVAVRGQNLAAGSALPLAAAGAPSGSATRAGRTEPPRPLEPSDGPQLSPTTMLRRKLGLPHPPQLTVSGQGPTVLLIMGQGAQGKVWDLHQRPALQRAGYRVITYDHLGVQPHTRYSFAEIVEQAAELLRAVGPAAPQRSAVVGTSLGARVAAALAARHPELVSCAVLCAAHSRLPAHPLPGGPLTTGAGSLPEDATTELVARVNLSPRTLADPVRARDWLGIIGMSLRSGPLSGSAPTDHVGGFDLTEEFRTLTCPTLLVGYADDAVIPAASVRELHHAIPGSAYAEIPHAGHWGYLEQPQACNQVLCEFLASAHPAGHAAAADRPPTPARPPTQNR